MVFLYHSRLAAPQCAAPANGSEFIPRAKYVRRVPSRCFPARDSNRSFQELLLSSLYPPPRERERERERIPGSKGPLAVLQEYLFSLKFPRSSADASLDVNVNNTAALPGAFNVNDRRSLPVVTLWFWWVLVVTLKYLLLVSLRVAGTIEESLRFDFLFSFFFFFFLALTNL